MEILNIGIEIGRDEDGMITQNFTISDNLCLYHSYVKDVLDALVSGRLPDRIDRTALIILAQIFTSLSLCPAADSKKVEEAETNGDT